MTQFQKGNQAAVGHGRGHTPARWTAEVKDTIQRVFDGLGGYEELLAWCLREPSNQSDFYKHIWVKLLPMQLNVKSHKDIVYRSVAEVDAALGERGLSLATIERLKQIDLRPDDAVEAQNDATDETS